LIGDKTSTVFFSAWEDERDKKVDLKDEESLEKETFVVLIVCIKLICGVKSATNWDK